MEQNQKNVFLHPAGSHTLTRYSVNLYVRSVVSFFLNSLEEEQDEDDKDDGDDDGEADHLVARRLLRLVRLGQLALRVLGVAVPVDPFETKLRNQEIALQVQGFETRHFQAMPGNGRVH